MEKKFDNFLFNASVDKSRYFIAKYYLKSNDMLKAAEGIAIGQSIGNPNVRLDSETSELLENHLSVICSSFVSLQIDLASQAHDRVHS